MFIKFSLLLLLFQLFPLFCFSQNGFGPMARSVSFDNRSYAFTAEQAKAIYKKEIIHKYEFLDGREYKMYDVTGSGSPQFNSSIGILGTVFFEGEAYPGCILSYDIYKDKLVYVAQSLIFGNCNFIEINMAKVDSFYLEVKTSPKESTAATYKQFRFVKIDFPDDGSSTLKTGYFEVANVGAIQLLIQHKAIMVSNQGVDALQSGLYKYEHILKKTICINGSCYEIDKKKKLVKLFPNKRKAINKKLSSYPFAYKNFKKEQLVEILQFINSI